VTPETEQATVSRLFGIGVRNGRDIEAVSPGVVPERKEQDIVVFTTLGRHRALNREEHGATKAGLLTRRFILKRKETPAS
jgi:hypothetical protein